MSVQGLGCSGADKHTFDLGNVGHPAGQQVFAAGSGKFLSVIVTVYARVCNEQCPAQHPASKVAADALNGIDIGGVARKYAAAHRKTFTGNGQCNDHLGAPKAILGMAEPPKIIWLIVFRIDGK